MRLRPRQRMTIHAAAANFIRNQPRKTSVRNFTAIALALCAILTAPAAYAVTCANGVYRAGCAGPNGAVVGRKPYTTTYPYSAHPYYHPPVRSPGTVSCANGVYRAGCAGPNGAAVVRKPY